MSLFFDSDADPQIVVKLPKPTRPHVRQPASLPNIQSVRGFHPPCFLLGPNRRLFSLKASPSDHTPAALFHPLRRRLSWTRAPLTLATRRLRYRTRSQTWSPAPPPLRRVRTLAPCSPPLIRQSLFGASALRALLYGQVNGSVRHSRFARPLSSSDPDLASLPTASVRRGKRRRTMWRTTSCEPVRRSELLFRSY